ncbi:cytochrome c551 [Actinomycetes bacterium NPDC127524]|uniref:cytochrome c551 n=1 Tax=unclassified Bacillus (in: firmicutes) TaxID=185979 RepID=UPI0008E098B5|nr:MULTISPECIES: cytochrome c [unclassified Bacillus (in: firmicutes)]OIK11404.1 cytochrome C551 [Bacillus sp. MUM 13]SFC24664.1 cytochrome c551 [Bacillus sp. OV322]
MKKKLFALLAGTSIVLAACGGGNDSSKNDTSSAGAGDAAKIFENKCSACHGQNLEGAVGPNLTKIGSKLTTDQIKKTIANGKGNMPAELITGKDADKVAEWLSKKK